LARELDLDLVEVAPLANPPVCRIMDFGKWRYEESQKAKESRKKATHISIKEVKFRPKIGKGDFDTKVRHIIGFLDEGHKVKVTLQFRGREMAHPELGTKVLNKVAEDSAEVGKVEAYPRQDGRNMTMVLAPDKKPLPKKEKVAEFGDDAPTDAEAAPETIDAAAAPEGVVDVEVAETEAVAEVNVTETEGVAETEAVVETTVEVAEVEVVAAIETPVAKAPAKAPTKAAAAKAAAIKASATQAPAEEASAAE
jgi:translation initiation factor IF-3